MSYLKEMAELGYTPDSIGSFHRTMIPYLLGRLGLGRDDLIVEVGAAQGHCILSAKRAGYANLAVLDVDPYNFQLFETQHQIACHRCDVEKDPFPFGDSQAGVVMGFHVIEHLREPGAFLGEALRVLRPGRVLALVTPDWRKQYRTFWRDPTHVHPYDKESIARLLRMHGLADVRTYSWGSAYGLGRLHGYRWIPQLGMIGCDVLALGVKR
jgi:SAM-dependent methyltransferase